MSNFKFGHMPNTVRNFYRFGNGASQGYFKPQNTKKINLTLASRAPSPLPTSPLNLPPAFPNAFPNAPVARNPVPRMASGRQLFSPQKPRPTRKNGRSHRTRRSRRNRY